MLISDMKYSVHSFSRVWLFVTPWTAARQASLSITNSQSLLKLMSIELLMPTNHLILCLPLLLLPSIFPLLCYLQTHSIKINIILLCFSFYYLHVETYLESVSAFIWDIFYFKSHLFNDISMSLIGLHIFILCY